MASFSGSDDLQGAAFTGVNLRGARFRESDLSDVTMRGVEVAGLDLDAPWLPFSKRVVINGVDVIAYVESELDRRFPGRGQRRAADPDGLRAAWAVLEERWAEVLDRAAGMPPETVTVSVDGEWSFRDTLRHLVLATDLWFGGGVLQQPEPFSPVGLAFDGGEVAAGRLTTTDPPYAEVLEVRAGRVAAVRDFLAGVGADELDAPRQNPHAPQHAETVRSCLHVVLEEEWEHLRFAVRDLDTLQARESATAG